MWQLDDHIQSSYSLHHDPPPENNVQVGVLFVTSPTETPQTEAPVSTTTAPVAAPTAVPTGTPSVELDPVSPVEAPTSVESLVPTSSPVELPPVTAPISPPVIAPIAAPVVAPIASPTTPLTIEEYLESTLTDDGSLSDESTPQYASLQALNACCPDLALPEDEEEIVDRYVLNTWYFALNGTGWIGIDTSLWTTDAPVCDWSGVGCEEEDTPVISLEFNTNNLAGEIPSELRGLSNLLILKCRR